MKLLRHLNRVAELAILGLVLLIIVLTIVYNRSPQASSQEASLASDVSVTATTSTEPTPTPTPFGAPTQTPGPDPSPVPVLPTLVITPVPTMSVADERRLEQERMNQPTSPPLPTPLADDPIRVTITVDGDSNTIPLVQGSDVIVLGTVREVAAPRWTTPDGKRPEDPRVAPLQGIVTPVLIDVEQYLQGELAQSQLEVWAWGGAIGEDSFHWEPDSRHIFFDGERVVIFLEPRIPSEAERPIWSNMQHYTITQDGEAKNSYHTLPLDQLLSEIRDAATYPTPSIPTPIATSVSAQ